MQTHLSSAIDAIEADKAQYDKNVKEFLADVQILARILKHTVDEVSELSIDEIIACIDTKSIEVGTVPIDPGLTNLGKVESVQTEDSVLNEGYITFDVRFSIRCHKQIKIIINVEAQKSADTKKMNYHIENRMIYYLSRLISSQKEVEFFRSEYDNIKKVYSIWICMDGKEDSIHKVFLTAENIFGNGCGDVNFDKMCGLIIRIRSKNNVKESKNKLIEMLEDMLSKEDGEQKKKKLETKYGMKMNIDLARRINDMCNLSDLVLEQGIEQGIERGMERERILIIEHMLKKGISLEQVADLTGYGIEAVLAVQKKLLQTV